MDKVLENNIVKKDALAFNLATELSNAHDQVDKSTDRLSQRILYDRINEFRNSIKNVKEGVFTIQNYEFEEYAPKIFELAFLENVTKIIVNKLCITVGLVENSLGRKLSPKKL